MSGEEITGRMGTGVMYVNPLDGAFMWTMPVQTSDSCKPDVIE